MIKTYSSKSVGSVKNCWNIWYSSSHTWTIKAQPLLICWEKMKKMRKFRLWDVKMKKNCLSSFIWRGLLSQIERHTWRRLKSFSTKMATKVFIKWTYSVVTNRWCPQSYEKMPFLTIKCIAQWKSVFTPDREWFLLSGTVRWKCSLGQALTTVPPGPLNLKIENLVLALGEEIAVQAVVGSIVWAFRRLKKPRCREMSARGYALHSLCPQLSFHTFSS